MSERLLERFRLNRLGEYPVHSGGKTPTAFFFAGVGGQCNNHRLVNGIAVDRTGSLCRVNSVDYRHLQVHKHEIHVTCRNRLNRRCPVGCLDNYR